MIIDKKIVNSKIDSGFRVKILVIGVGGGGSSIVSELAGGNVKKADFVAINTDAQALKEVAKKPNLSTLLVGKNLTDGLGTGMDPLKGEKAAIESEKEIKEILTGYDFVILVSCLGGGSGSGIISTITKVSKELGNITYGIFTYPFNFEGKKRKAISNTAINKIKNEIDSFSIVLNQKIFDFIDKDTGIEEAFSFINQKLNKSLSGLIDTISEPGLINTDWADLQTIFRQKGGLAYLSSVDIDVEKLLKIDTAEDFNRLILSNSVYSYNIENSKGVLLNIFTGKDINLNHINKISSFISELANENAKIIIGVDDKKNVANIMLLAVGCSDEIIEDSDKDFEISDQATIYNNIKKESTDDSYWEIPTFIRKRK